MKYLISDPAVEEVEKEACLSLPLDSPEENGDWKEAAD